MDDPSRERPKTPRKRSGNTHAKDLKHPGNAQETLTRKAKNTQETLRKRSRERPKTPRKHSGNAHAKDLEHPGNRKRSGNTHAEDQKHPGKSPGIKKKKLN